MYRRSAVVCSDATTSAAMFWSVVITLSSVVDWSLVGNNLSFLRHFFGVRRAGYRRQHPSALL